MAVFIHLLLILLTYSCSFPKVTTTAPLGKELTVTPKLGYFTHIRARFTFKRRGMILNFTYAKSLELTAGAGNW